MEKHNFLNDYISDCALYLIGGIRGSAAHYFLYHEICRIRNKEQESEEITYTQVSIYVTQIVTAWEMVNAAEKEKEKQEALKRKIDHGGKKKKTLRRELP